MPSLATTLKVAAALSATTAPIQSFDYVIVGAGTCGLVIANRLTELANVTVALIEYGDDVSGNTNVTDVLGYGLAFGTDIDYAYETVAQEFADGRVVPLRAAKALGGTSTINGMAYTRAPKEQINTWETIGNEGWNWDNLWPYYTKHEDFPLPLDFQIEDGVAWNPSFHGEGGPVQVTWPYSLVNSTIFDTFNKTYTDASIPWLEDVNGGAMNGFSWHPKFIDRDADVRVDAANAYYYPVQDRPNLSVFLLTHANKIVWNSTEGIPVAGGVEVTTANGTTATIYANKEVIVSAGSLRSSIVLELSGIGNPDILAKYDIDTVVNLPSVGENLQEQVNNQMFYNTSIAFDGVSSFVAYPTAAMLFGDEFESIRDTFNASLPAYAEKVASQTGNVSKAADLLLSFQMQFNLQFAEENPVPVTEIYNTVLDSEYDIEYWGLLPFSRGNVHINSSDPYAASLINPNYFMLEWDQKVQIETGRFVRNTLLANGSEAATLITAQTIPTEAELALDADDAAFLAWSIGEYRPNYHPIGTTAMLPQEIGGVVNNKLQVYGTANVRVIDASVLPFQVCGHLTSTLYAVAERAADLIKADL